MMTDPGEASGAAWIVIGVPAVPLIVPYASPELAGTESQPTMKPVYVPGSTFSVSPGSSDFIAF